MPVVQPFNPNSITIDGNLTVNDDGTGNYGKIIANVTTGLTPSGDTTGVTDSANITALINLGASQVELGPGNFYVALTIAKAFRMTGAGIGLTTLKSVSGSAMFNFNNVSLNGVEIEHLTIDATGSDIFTNVNLHRSYFHHLEIFQRSGANCIMTLGANGSSAGGANTGLSTTTFEDILQHVYCDPASGVRTVPGWYLYDNNGSGKNIDVVNFSRVRSINETNNSKIDNTQFVFDIGCQIAGSGGLADRVSFINCDFGQVLGGAIRCLSVQGLLIEQCGTGNIFTQFATAIGNSMIKVGQFAGAAVSQSPLIVGYVRESSGTMTFGSSSDIEVDSATTNATIINPDETGAAGNPAVKINLNSSAGAMIINPQSNVSISNAASDTVQLGPGKITIGTQVVAPQAEPVTAKAAAPAATASTTLVMMGMAVAFTPAGSGKVLVTLTGSAFTNTAAIFGNYGGRYGTGTAPVNGAAVTGTRFGAGADPNFRAPSIGSTVPAQIALTDVITGLTPGTAYWFDLALSTSNASDTAQVQNVSISIIEIP